MRMSRTLCPPVGAVWARVDVHAAIRTEAAVTIVLTLMRGIPWLQYILRLAAGPRGCKEDSPEDPSARR